MYFIPSSSPDAACRIENESWQGFHLFYKKPLQLFKYSLCVSLNASLMLQRLLCLHTQKSTKLLTVVSCADSDGRDGVSSLAVTLFLSLRSQWQSVLFLAMAVQNQSSMMDSNNSGSSLSLTSRDLLHTLISHWINNLTQEKAQGVNQCLIWSWANSGGRSAFKRLDKRYYLDNKHSYRKRPYQMWNEYGLSKICFQLLLILCKVKALDDAVREGSFGLLHARLQHLEALGFVSAPCSAGGEGDAGNTPQLSGTLWEAERKLLFYYKVCQMISEKMWYHSYALPSWRDAAHLGSHLELTYNSFGLVWALSETAPYAVFT